MQDRHYFSTMLRKIITIVTIIASAIAIGASIAVTTNVAVGAPQYRIERTLLPEVTSTYELGTSTRTWLNGFFDTICLGGVCQSAWGGGSLSGGIAGTIASWVNGSTLTATSTVNANAFNATSTTATSTFNGGFSARDLRITSLASGLLKVNGSGYTGLASAGTDYQAPLTAGVDYEVPLTFSTGVQRIVNAVTCVTGSGTVFGCLSATDWNTFNNKISSSSLSGTAPIGYNSGTGVISITQSSRTTNGQLSSTDFTTFDNKVSSTSLSATSPLFYVSGTGVFTIQAGNGSQNGYISSTDWNTFQNKISSSSLSATGPVTYNSGTGVIALTTGYFVSTTTSNTWASTQTFGLITSTGATSTSLALTNLSAGLLKSNAGGAIGNASAGTDYESPLTFSTGVSRSVNAITCVTGTASVFGCLPSADFIRFDGRLSSSSWYTLFAGTSTTGLLEGTNLYWTSARGTSTVSALIAGTTTTALNEGTNLYYTSARASSSFYQLFAGTSTTGLVEGTRLYYTVARARADASWWCLNNEHHSE
jgi:hypothetical protein